MTKDEAQRSIRTFYEAVIFRQEDESEEGDSQYHQTFRL